MRFSIISIIKVRFIEILAFVLFIGLISNIFQLILLKNEITKDMHSQATSIAKRIKESIAETKLVSDSIEHQIDLRLIAYSKNIADLLGDKDLDQITNEELEIIRQNLGISGITLFARRGDDIVGIKATDPKEIGFGFKQFQNGGLELIDSVLKGKPVELLPVSYIDNRAIVTPVTKSGSQSDAAHFFKYAHYHTPGTSYLISSYIEANDVFQHINHIGPDHIIQKLKEENRYIDEIGVLDPKVFQDPGLEKQIYPSLRKIVYGTFNETDSEDINVLKHFDWNAPYHHFSYSKDGKKLYKTFLPMDQDHVVFISLNYEEIKSPIDQHLVIIMILAVLSFIVFVLLANKISRKTKETEEELWKSNQILSSIIQNSPLGIIVFSKDQRIMLWNKSAENIFGRSASEVVGQFFNQCLQDRNDERFRELMMNAQREMSSNIEVVSQKMDGSSVTISCSVAPLLDSKNHCIGYVTIHKDITNRKKMEEKLLHTEKLSIVSELSAAIAHEIRNPLTSIKGFVQLIKETSHDHQFYLDIMEMELNRINDIVSEFMSLSKPQAHQFSVKDVRMILQQTFPLFESMANLNNIRITTDFSNESLAVNCIEHQIKQVFINIMKNSIEAMPNNGHLHITANLMGNDKISIRFIDNGSGISEDRLKKLGEPFFTTKEKGSGLGLMICYKIIQTHEGAIRISSTVGYGTTVDIVLPVKPTTTCI